MCGHFKPIQTRGLNNYVVVIVFPNLGEFSELNFLSAIVIKFFGMVIKLQMNIIKSIILKVVLHE